jgi:hypothetical protein
MAGLRLCCAAYSGPPAMYHVKCWGKTSIIQSAVNIAQQHAASQHKCRKNASGLACLGFAQAQAGWKGVIGSKFSPAAPPPPRQQEL